MNSAKKKFLKKQKLQGLEKEMMNQFGTNKMVAKPFVSLLLGFKLRPFGLGGKMDIPHPREGRDTKSAFPWNQSGKGNRLALSSQWIKPWPYLFTARHDVCMYKQIKYPKLLLSRDYGVSLCSAACTSLEREPLWKKMACCSYQFPSPKWILHFSQRHTLGLSLALTKGLCLGAFA